MPRQEIVDSRAFLKVFDILEQVRMRSGSGKIDMRIGAVNA